MARLSINEIAKRADVSIATVSRVMNNNGPVKKDTRQRIIRIVREMNYDNPAQLNETKSIGIVLPYLINEFCTPIYMNSANQKYNFFFTPYQENESTLRNSIQSLLSMPVDGILLMITEKGINAREILSEIFVPVVGVNTPSDCGCNATFNINNRQGALAAVNHLIQQHGFQKIAMIKGPEKNQDAEDRFLGFQDAHQANGIEINPQFIINGDFGYPSGFYGLCRLLSLSERPEAVFIANDMMAAGAYEAVANWNLKIGEDIAIIGFDDIEQSKAMSPSLTTVSSHFYEVGEKALNHLLSIIDGETPYDRNINEKISSGLIIRESCGCHIKKNLVR